MKNKRNQDTLNLEYNFDKKAKLEIAVPARTTDEWREVSPEIFRTWMGKRKVDGKLFEGKTYIYLTNNSI